MSRKYNFYDDSGTYFLSTSVVEWLDVFTRRRYKDIVIDSLDYCSNHKSLIIYGYVIMSNHIHLLISKSDSKHSFSDIIRDFKKFTAMQIIKTIKDSPDESRRKWMLYMMKKQAEKNSNNTNYQFWKQHNQPIQVEGDWVEEKLNYIHQNPVKAGWVDQPELFLYSSARNYAGISGLLNITSIYDGEEI